MCATDSTLHTKTSQTQPVEHSNEIPEQYMVEDPRMRRISNGCYLIALYLKPFFCLIPVVEAFQLQSRRKRKYLQLPASTLQKCWLSTFQI